MTDHITATGGPDVTSLEVRKPESDGTERGKIINDESHGKQWWYTKYANYYAFCSTCLLSRAFFAALFNPLTACFTFSYCRLLIALQTLSVKTTRSTNRPTLSYLSETAASPRSTPSMSVTVAI